MSYQVESPDFTTTFPKFLPRSLIQVAEGFCSAEDIIATFDALDPREKELMISEFNPVIIANDVKG